jgi:hypothetical protein
VVRGDRWFRGVDAAAAAMVEEEVEMMVAMALLDLHIRFALGLRPTMGSERSTPPPTTSV